VYITGLAYQVLNNGSSPQLEASLKKGGLMLGNPVTRCAGESYTGKDDVLLLNTKVNIYYWHGMTSRRAYDNWNNNSCNVEVPPSPATCIEIFAGIESAIGFLDQPTKEMFAKLERNLQPSSSVNPDMLYYSYCTGNGTLDFDTAIVPNCFTLDQQVSVYLNQPSVQSAIHAQPTNWGECSVILYNQNAGSVIPYLNNFFSVASSMRILYYSGDCDFATVPFPQTQRCLETLNRKITHKWRPYVINKEVAGYVEIYDTYTFTTIKGAGHEAPEYQPAAGYLVFSSFLTNKHLPE
jgi:serine carboxypeptidase-like clade 2